MLLAVGPHIQSGPDRGLVLHKLLEEVLSRETAGDVAILATGKVQQQIGFRPDTRQQRFRVRRSTSTSSSLTRSDHH